MRGKGISFVIGGGVLLSGLALTRAQEAEPGHVSQDEAAAVEHPNCSAFGATRNKFRKPGTASTDSANSPGAITKWVVKELSFVPGDSRTKSFQDLAELGIIDQYLYADMEAAGVTPADKTTDAEFLRRASLDLTGRIPTADRVVSFLADTSTAKRAKLVDELLASSSWVDKWTMYFGDLFQNTETKPSVNLRRFDPGRNAFWKWIKDSLAANKPYNQMASELISAQGENSYTQGNVNWVVGAWVIGTPAQDNFDQAAANTAETFLGIGHMNCILCHNGRVHLDELSLWGKTAARTSAWGLAAYFAKTSFRRVAHEGLNTYYWSLQDTLRADYTLGTTNGNRPARTAGTARTVTPVYPFSGNAPNAGENYRVALAREVTSDFQFARAAVNYIWKELFGIGLVDPPNQFDPARLDPDNPPPAPWTLQPSNARLLNALARNFIESGYDLRALLRLMVNSEAYQLSARYYGAAPDNLFARKLVRRLWPEEIHDAIVQSSNILPSYNVNGFSSYAALSPFTQYPTYGNVTWAMQFPDVINMPDRGAVGQLLDSFLRGDRDGEERKPEGSLLQSLNLMNDNFVLSRISATAGTATALLRSNLSKPDDQLVDALYLAVLSRYPAEAEKTAAVASLKLSDRNTRASNMLWSLYNKVDFIFNY